VDIGPIKLRPTWINNRSSQDIVTKISNFWFEPILIHKVEKLKTWVGATRIFDHYPIRLEFDTLGSKAVRKLKRHKYFLYVDNYL